VPHHVQTQDLKKSSYAPERAKTKSISKRVESRDTPHPPPSLHATGLYFLLGELSAGPCAPPRSHGIHKRSRARGKATGTGVEVMNSNTSAFGARRTPPRPGKKASKSMKKQEQCTKHARKGHESEGRGQRTEDRGQRAENRKQVTVIRDQRAECGARSTTR
jgi:hypothetical protein